MKWTTSCEHDHKTDHDDDSDKDDGNKKKKKKTTNQTTLVPALSSLDNVGPIKPHPPLTTPYLRQTLFSSSSSSWSSSSLNRLQKSARYKSPLEDQKTVKLERSVCANPLSTFATDRSNWMKMLSYYSTHIYRMISRPPNQRGNQPIQK